MEKIEKPLTWMLIIGILGYLFMANFYKTECSTKVKKEIIVEVQVDDKNLNIDSMIDTVIENIVIEGNVDTVIKNIYFKNIWGEDSLDLNGNRVIFETETKE